MELWRGAVAWSRGVLRFFLYPGPVVDVTGSGHETSHVLDLYRGSNQIRWCNQRVSEFGKSNHQWFQLFQSGGRCGFCLQLGVFVIYLLTVAADFSVGWSKRISQ